MFRFSCKILATTIMTHVNNNVLNILLGHYFSPRDTGNYNQAYQWNTKCYSLVQSMVAHGSVVMWKSMVMRILVTMRKYATMRWSVTMRQYLVMQ